MNQKKLEIIYDSEDDTLEIFLGVPSECYYDEIDDDLFEGHDEETGELKGYKIFNFLHRGGMKNVKVMLPAEVEIKSSQNI